MIGGTVGGPTTSVPRTMGDRTATDIVREALGEHYVEQGEAPKSSWILKVGLYGGGALLTYWLLRKLLKGRRKR